MKNPVLLVIGTRPEGIKMIPVYFALKKAQIPVLLCSTAQHTNLLDEVFTLFDVKPDIELSVMKVGQDLFHITESVLNKMKDLIRSIKPSWVVVQGDTTTAMAAAMAAFYERIPIAHVEAGLRTASIHSPFPEEFNRRVIGMIANLHCVPTTLAMNNLLSEKIDKSNIVHTGNTVVDALYMIREKILTHEIEIDPAIKAIVASKKIYRQLVLLTIHRRESFGQDIRTILNVVKELALAHPDVLFFYPYHPNPNVMAALDDVDLKDIPNICLSKPVAYKELVYILLHVDWVATDSGGICEESVSLGKPVIILRNETERIEAVWERAAKLVGTQREKLFTAMKQMIEKPMNQNQPRSIYGDRYAAQKIVNELKSRNFEENKIKIAVNHNQINRIPMKKRVCIVGLGYIGLPTSIVAAQAGYEVIGFDIDVDRVAKINEGRAVIEEPDLAEKLQRVIEQKMFHATAQIEPADYFIIAVPTPFNEDKTADLSYVWAAGRSVAEVLKKNDVVILESTVPVGTTEKLAQLLSEETELQAGVDFFVAHCPERVLPGNIFRELITNPRIIGGVNQDSMNAAKLFYKEFVAGELYLTNAATAEMVKLVENSSRDVQIAFANQVADMAYASNLNPFEVIDLANKHPRVNILSPSCGVGGHCIAVDPWFLIETFPSNTHLLKATRKVNDEKPLSVIKAIEHEVFNWERIHKEPCTVAILGLTYKPDIDDLRESPALAIAQELAKRPYINLLACEPHVSQEKCTELLGKPSISVAHAIAQADIVVCLVKHRIFKDIDRDLLKDKTVLDICGLFHRMQDQEGQEQLYWPANNLFYRMHRKDS